MLIRLIKKLIFKKVYKVPNNILKKRKIYKTKLLSTHLNIKTNSIFIPLIIKIYKI